MAPPAMERNHWMAPAKTSDEQGPSAQPQASGQEPGIPKSYDFRNPDKFSKEHLRGLRMVFDTFARLSASSLSWLLRGQVHVSLASVEQVPYEHFIARLPAPTAAGLLTCSPLPDRFVLELSIPAAYAMVDRMLGGSGIPVQQVRDVTDIEGSLLGRVVGQLLPSYREAWSAIVSVDPRLEEMIFSPTLIPSAVPGTVAALAQLELNILGVNGSMNVAIPYAVLEPVMGRLNSQRWLAAPGHPRPPEPETPFPDARLQHAAVPVAVVLGTAAVALRELLRLQPGHVIQLNTTPGAPLSVVVGSQAKFTGVPGLLNNRVAVQLTDVLQEDDSDPD